MTSQREVRKRRIQAEKVAASRPRRGMKSGRGSLRRTLVGLVAVIVVVMMVASLAVGIFASGI